MRHEEFKQRRRALDEQYHADLELVRACYRTKVQALETLWMSSAETEAIAAPPPPLLTAPPGEPSHSTSETPPVSETPGGSETPPGTDTHPVKTRRRGGVRDDVQNILDRLPTVFDRWDVVRALGYEPPRATLFRALSSLIRDDFLGLLPPAFDGPRENMPSRYRKIGASPETGNP